MEFEVRWLYFIHMDNEPDWAKVLRVLYYEGGRLHDWQEPDDFGAIRPEDVGTEEYHKYIEWHEELASIQYQRIDDETRLGHEAINDALNWLDKHNLVTKKEPVTDGEYQYEARCPVKLNQSGFELAREQAMLNREEQREEQRTRQQHSVNRAVAYLTLGLMTVTVLDSAVRAFVGRGDFLPAFYTVIAGGVLVLLFAAVLGHFGLLSPYSPSHN